MSLLSERVNSHPTRQECETADGVSSHRITELIHLSPLRACNLSFRGFCSLFQIGRLSLQTCLFKSARDVRGSRSLLLYAVYQVNSHKRALSALARLSPMTAF